MFSVIRVTTFSGKWIDKYEQWLTEQVDGLLEKLESITTETSPHPDLKNLLTRVRAFELGVRLVKNPSLFARWTFFFGTIYLATVYVYTAVLFSFVYYGVARVNGHEYSWTELLVTSLFIPFLIGDLPRDTLLKFIGGLHCTLIAGVGLGTIVRLVQKRFEALRSVATVVSVRFTENGDVRRKILLLEQMFPDEKDSASKR
jgi:hypothetical protein